MFQLLLVFSSKKEVLFNYGTSFVDKLLRDTKKSTTSEARSTLEDRDILMQLFSPLIASFSTMQETLHMPYNYIETDTNQTVLFKNKNGFVILAIAGPSWSDAKHYLFDALNRVEWILDSLFGPCWQQLAPENAQKKKSASDLLSAMLQELWRLSVTDFNIMFNAIERIHISEHANMGSKSAEKSLKERGSDFLVHCMNDLKRMGDKRVKHFLIFVGTKLFSLYSVQDAAQISTRSLLLVIILSNILLQKDSAYSFTNDFDGDNFFSCDEASNVEDFHSADSSGDDIQPSLMKTMSISGTSNITSSVKIQKVRSASSDKDIPKVPLNGLKAPAGNIGQYADQLRANIFTSSLDNNNAKPDITSSISSNEGDCFSPIVVNVEKQKSDKKPHSFTGSNESVMNNSSECNYKIIRVFLKSANGITPCLLHIQKLYANISLVCIQEMDGVKLANNLTNYINSIHDILVHQNSQLLIDRFHLLHKTIKQYTKPADGLSLMIESLQQQIIRLEDEAKSSHGKFTISIETILDNVFSHLFRIFSIRFLFYPLQIDVNVCQSLSNSLKYIRRPFKDYFPFLSIKACRNLAPTGFYSLYPGLVYFVWVLRSADVLIAPTPDFDFLNDYLKERIWKTISKCRNERIQLGYKEIYYRDTFLQFSYCYRSSPLGNMSLPNLIDNSFELCLVHLSSVNRSIVALHQTSLITNLLRHLRDPASSLALLT